MQETVAPKSDRWMIDKIDVKFIFDSYRPYFEDDKEPRNCYIVTVKYNGKQTSFTYGDSLADTQAGLKPKKKDILEIISSDFYITKEYYPKYQDFAPEFGFDPDSIKGQRTYQKCIVQGEKLHKVFDEDEMRNLREELEY